MGTMVYGERCWSGLTGAPGKRVSFIATVGSNPTLSANSGFSKRKPAIAGVSIVFNRVSLLFFYNQVEITNKLIVDIKLLCYYETN